MPSTEIDNWLQAGIAAAKAGEREKAHKLLMDVLRANEKNETAWLWLSGVVNTRDERQICLENVLTLNPDNQMAQRGLDKLGISLDYAEDVPMPLPKMEEKVLRREHVPFSPASAILYPERHIQEIRWQEPVVEQKVQKEILQTSTYDDVWSRNEEICAYCAHQIKDNDDQCPNCKQNLTSKRFTYEKPTSSLHIYWVLLAGLGQLFLIEVIIRIIVGRHYLTAGGYGLLLVLLWGMAAGIYFRQTWAYISSLVTLAMLLLGFLANAFVEVNFSSIGLVALDSSIRDFVTPLVKGVLDFLMAFEITTAVLGLIYGIFKVAPEFDQMDTKLVATLTKGRRTAADYHTIAQRLAGKGLWASAVLHWQRASAQEPSRITYQKQLGLAYARLGFYQRGLDVLQSTLDLSTHAPTREKIKRQIHLLKERVTI